MKINIQTEKLDIETFIKKYMGSIVRNTLNNHEYQIVAYELGYQRVWLEEQKEKEILFVLLDSFLNEYVILKEGKNEIIYI